MKNISATLIKTLTLTRNPSAYAIMHTSYNAYVEVKKKVEWPMGNQLAPLEQLMRENFTHAPFAQLSSVLDEE